MINENMTELESMQINQKPQENPDLKEYSADIQGYLEDCLNIFAVNDVESGLFYLTKNAYMKYKLAQLEQSIHILAGKSKVTLEELSEFSNNTTVLNNVKNGLIQIPCKELFKNSTDIAIFNQDNKYLTTITTEDFDAAKTIYFNSTLELCTYLGLQVERIFTSESVHNADEEYCFNAMGSNHCLLIGNAKVILQ